MVHSADDSWPGFQANKPFVDCNCILMSPAIINFSVFCPGLPTCKTLLSTVTSIFSCRECTGDIEIESLAEGRLASMGSALRAHLQHKPDANRIAPALAYGECAVVQCSADLLCFFRLIGQAVAESSDGVSDESSNVTPQPQVAAPSGLPRGSHGRSCKYFVIVAKFMLRVISAASAVRHVYCMIEVYWCQDSAACA